MRRLALLFVLAASANAFAEPCSTSSRGLHFFSDLYSINQSSSDVVNRCQFNRMTSNDECVRNLRCGFGVRNPYPSGSVTCMAQSRGLMFMASNHSSNLSSAIDSALTQCQLNRFTSNDECTRSLRCEDSRLMPVSHDNLCTTMSRGLRFERRGDVSTASNSVVNECQLNRFTSNEECVRNLQCHVLGGVPGPVMPPVPPVVNPGHSDRGMMCELSTARRVYRGEGMDRQSAVRDAKAECRRVERAIECNRNSEIRCFAR